MKNFEDFYKDLTSDERWFEQASIHHKPETFRKVAEQVYTLGLSDRDNFEIVPLREHRNHVVNKLNKITPDKVKINWVEKALEKQKVEQKEKEAPPVSWEKRAEYLNKIQEIIKGSTMMSGVPRPSYKEQAEEGLPPKPAPYPATSSEERYLKDRRFAYITYAFEPRTGKERPGVMSEEEFNYEYDELMLNKEGK
jgi:hypothetical protein